MTIDCSKSGTELRVCPQGRLDSSTGDALESFLAENVTDGIEKLVLDFSGVDLISSKGLRVLVSAYKNLNGGTMEVVNANPAVREVFRLSGLLKTFNIE